MRELFDEVAGQSPFDPEEAVRRATRVPQRKRFYTSAGTAEADGGFAVTLDGKPIRTPSGRQVVVPNRVIAEAIAAEWNAQGETVNPLTMPLTRFANSVGEAVVDRVDAVAEDAAANDLGAHFILAEGIVHVAQPEPAIRAARATFPADPWSVAALHVVTTLTGSALLALALYHGVRSPDEVWAAAHVDEDWNIEKWGIDDEVAARRKARLVDFTAAVTILKGVKP
jgi:chaperone required for assembly of F1-ATPase